MLGNITTQGGILNKNVFLLDTKTYTWITNFQAKQPASSPSNSGTQPVNSNIVSYPQSSNSSTGIIIAVSIVGSLVIVVSGILIIFFIIKYKRNNQNNQNGGNRQSYQDYQDYQNRENHQSYQNNQNGENRQSYQDYQNNQGIIEIPSSSDMRYSLHY